MKKTLRRETFKRENEASHCNIEKEEIEQSFASTKMAMCDQLREK